jgi:hypothetical protein
VSSLLVRRMPVKRVPQADTPMRGVFPRQTWRLCLRLTPSRIMSFCIFSPLTSSSSHHHPIEPLAYVPPTPSCSTPVACPTLHHQRCAALLAHACMHPWQRPPSTDLCYSHGRVLPRWLGGETQRCRGKDSIVIMTIMHPRKMPMAGCLCSATARLFLALFSCSRCRIGPVDDVAWPINLLRPQPLLRHPLARPVVNLCSTNRCGSSLPRKAACFSSVPHGGNS